MEGVFFAIVVIVSLVRGLYLFFRGVSRGLARLTTPTVPPPAGGQRMPQPGMPQAGRPAAMAPRPPGRADTPAMPPPPTPRRPDAGSPAVSQEATSDSFRTREAELLSTEAAASRTVSGQPPGITPGTGLFRGSDDLVRAFILQELLGPPLSKRRPPPR